MPRFETSVLLNAQPEVVFDFHQNPHNIRKISPWFLQVVDVEAETEAIPGSLFYLKLRIFGLPLSWKGRWAEVIKPHCLVDTATKFPFRNWRHEHRFAVFEDQTRMTDQVDYQVPGGRIGELIFRLQLILMFSGRHRATARYFAAR